MKVEVIKAQENNKNLANPRKIERMRVAAYCRVSTDDEDQINHTIALYIMKKCCEDGKISRTAYEKMTRKYENKILEKNNR